MIADVATCRQVPRQACVEISRLCLLVAMGGGPVKGHRASAAPPAPGNIRTSCTHTSCHEQNRGPFQRYENWSSWGVARGQSMKLPRRRFLHLAAGAAALPAVSRIARAQAYPTRPVRIIVGFAAWRRGGHRRAPDGSMAVGAARPAVHRREPAGRRQQYRHRGGRQGAPTATRSSWSLRRTRSTRRSTTSSISISFATLRRSPASCACPMSWR